MPESEQDKSAVIREFLQKQGISEADLLKSLQTSPPPIIDSLPTELEEAHSGNAEATQAADTGPDLSAENILLVTFKTGDSSKAVSLKVAQLSALYSFSVLDEPEIISVKSGEAALSLQTVISVCPQGSPADIAFTVMVLDEYGESTEKVILSLAEIQQMTENEKLTLESTAPLVEVVTGRTFIAGQIEGVTTVTPVDYSRLPEKMSSFCPQGLAFGWLWAGFKLNKNWFYWFFVPPPGRWISNIILAGTGWTELWKTKQFRTVEEMQKNQAIVSGLAIPALILQIGFVLLVIIWRIQANTP